MVESLLLDRAMMADSVLQAFPTLDLTKIFDYEETASFMDGVEIDDDLEGLLVFKQDTTFALTFEKLTPLCVEPMSEEEAFVASTLLEPLLEDEKSPERSRRKKRRSDEMEQDATSSTTTRSSTVVSPPPVKVLVTSSELTSDHPSVDINSALLKFASSMRRSEETRKELKRRAQATEGEEASIFAKVSLSPELDQSRSMLQAYIDQMKGGGKAAMATT